MHRRHNRHPRQYPQSRTRSPKIERVETTQAFYTAEAGMDMAIREMMNNWNNLRRRHPRNDPTFGQAQVVVIVTVAGPPTTLRSKGRSGDARREVETVLE